MLKDTKISHVEIYFVDGSSRVCSTDQYSVFVDLNTLGIVDTSSKNVTVIPLMRVDKVMYFAESDSNNKVLVQ
jgi:hypothetical protein